MLDKDFLFQVVGEDRFVGPAFFDHSFTDRFYARTIGGHISHLLHEHQSSQYQTGSHCLNQIDEHGEAQYYQHNEYV